MSDQGRQFESDLFSALCKLLEIRKQRTTPGHPAANGQVERYNRLILSLVRCHLDNGNNHWDEKLPLLSAAVRSMVNCSTGFTANMLMLGREVRLPTDLIFQKPTETAPEYPTLIKELLRSMKEAHEMARKHLGGVQHIQKETYDAKLVAARYAPGDLVYKTNTNPAVGHNRKLQPQWVGPLLVLEAKSDVTYKVRGRKKTLVLHHNNLRPCRDRAIPFWMRRLRHRVLNDLDNEDVLEGIQSACLYNVDNSNDTNDTFSIPDTTQSTIPSDDDSEIVETENSNNPGKLPESRPACSRPTRTRRRPGHLDDYVE